MGETQSGRGHHQAQQAKVPSLTDITGKDLEPSPTTDNSINQVGKEGYIYSFQSNNSL